MTPGMQTISLADFGNVPSSYQHETRVAIALDPIALPHTVFKWYHVHRQGVPVTAALDAEARRVLLDAALGGAWTAEYGLNFAMLHVSTAHAFMIAAVWRGHQEMWVRVYAKELASDGPFERVEASPEDWAALCVWEMGVSCHERMAWQRYLFSARDEAAKQDWLADTYNGWV